MSNKKKKHLAAQFSKPQPLLPLQDKGKETDRTEAKEELIKSGSPPSALFSQI